MSSDKENLLLASILFSELSQSEISHLTQITHQKLFEKNEVVFYQGDEGTQLYVIANGKVQISVSSDMGKELIFCIKNSGDIFGEIAVFSQVNRTATALTLEKTELLIIHRHELIPFLHKNPEVAVKIIASLCKRLKAFNDDMEDILFYGLPKRLAKKLLALKASYSKESSPGVIDLRLSQTALGNMVSASRESVNKQMKVWESEDILSYKQGIITLLREDVIQDIALNE